MGSGQSRWFFALFLFGIFHASGLSQASSGVSYPRLSGVLETYFTDDPSHRGFYNQLSWGNVDFRASDQWRFTGSAILSGGITRFDEMCARYDQGDAVIRAGRIRTRFGLSDWSDLFYNGFNHLPLVRSLPLTEDLKLSRDDDGFEATVPVGLVSLEAALVDTQVGSQQVVPQSLDHGILRAEGIVDGVILGLDLLDKFRGLDRIYGADARYTLPHWKFRGEIFKAEGEDAESGYYVDATYRLPSTTRTELVARTDHIFRDEGHVQLETVGVRQIFCRNFTLNLNYVWGDNPSSSEYQAPSNSLGFSARAMFQVQF